MIDYVLVGIILSVIAILSLFALSHIVRTLVTVGIFAAIGFSGIYVWSQFSNTAPTETIRQIFFSKQAKRPSKSDIEFNRLIVREPARPTNGNNLTTLAEIEHHLGLRS